MKQVNRLIKTNLLEKIEKKKNDKSEPIGEKDQFDEDYIKKLLYHKNRKNVYDIKEEDFYRVKSLR